MSKQDYTNCPKARTRIDVNNHLGMLHNTIRNYIPISKNIDIKPYDNEKYKNIISKY